jgi:plasmid stabilization system protein ParE
MANFKLTLLAQRDLRAIYDYIAANNRKAATRYIGTLKNKCQALADTPQV